MSVAVGDGVDASCVVFTSCLYENLPDDSKALHVHACVCMLGEGGGGGGPGKTC
jgi:hypothetical protein